MVFKRELEKQIADLEDKLANADYQLEGRDNEIRELKAQIEKIKKCLRGVVYMADSGLHTKNKLAFARLIAEARDLLRSKYERRT